MISLQIDQHSEQGIVLITLQGEFLGENDQSLLQEQIRRLVEAGTRQIIIDLRDVHHMNSFGLGALVAARTTLRRVGGDLLIARVCEGIQRLLSLTRLVRIFNISDTVEEAFARCKSN